MINCIQEFQRLKKGESQGFKISSVSEMPHKNLSKKECAECVEYVTKIKEMPIIAIGNA